jgi:DNA-binding NtrC family response regulator
VDSTETAIVPATRHGGAAATGTPPYLVLAHDCRAPLAPGARFLLDDLDEVVIGRGDVRRSERLPVGERNRLAVLLADDWVSRHHVRIESRGGRWWIEDLGSKNGTRVNGAAVASTLLHDGDVVVVGHTLWVFRDAHPEGPPDPLAERESTAPADPSSAMHTFSCRLGAAFHQLRRVAPTPVAVLITGETGTGKDVLAQAVHRASQRSGPLVPLNCSALPKTLIEAELFGVKRGAYTGATEDRLGHVRAAADGTLFLDEIGDLPLETQGVLLRVLEQREVTPVGATQPIQVNLRVIAATNRDLDEMVAAGTFRRDLLARLRGFAVHLPPLADRREDLGFLLAAALRRAAGDRAGTLTVERDLSEWLFGYGWPGNVRELVQVTATLCAVAPADELRRADLPAGIAPTDTVECSVDPVERAADPLETLADPDAAQRQRLTTLLKRHRGNVTLVARDLGTSRSQVRRLAERHGLDVDSFRA